MNGNPRSEEPNKLNEASDANWKAEWDKIKASPRLTLKKFLPMLFVRFGSRDMLWLMLVMGVAFGWWANTRDLRRDYDRTFHSYLRMCDVADKVGLELELNKGEGPRYDEPWRFNVPKNLRDELGAVIVSNP